MGTDVEGAGVGGRVVAGVISGGAVDDDVAAVDATAVDEDDGADEDDAVEAELASPLSPSSAFLQPASTSATHAAATVRDTTETERDDRQDIGRRCTLTRGP